MAGKKALKFEEVEILEIIKGAKGNPYEARLISSYAKAYAEAGWEKINFSTKDKKDAIPFAKRAEVAKLKTKKGQWVVKSVELENAKKDGWKTPGTKGTGGSGKGIEALQKYFGKIMADKIPANEAEEFVAFMKTAVTRYENKENEAKEKREKLQAFMSQFGMDKAQLKSFASLLD